MINQAMYIVRQDQLNDFTAQLKNVAIEKPCIVRLRNGILVRDVRFQAEYYHEQAQFHTMDWRYSWRLDGSSVTSQSLDIVEWLEEH